MAINLRVTQQSIATRVMTGLQGNLGRIGDLQQQLSSGKILSRPSDSPTGTVSAMQLRGEMRATQQHARNAEDGLGWLNTIDSTLTSVSTQVNRVRDLTLQANSAGASSAPEAREALAVEVENIREALIALANTRYLDRPVFGGTTAGGAAYDANGAYVGDAGRVYRTVGDGTKVRVDANGPEAFGTGPQQLFNVLTSIATNMRENAGSLGGDLDNLDGVISSIRTQLADVGARANRVTNMRQTAEDRLLTLKTQLSDVEDIDLPETIMQLKLQEVAYQAALAATAKVVQPSLMDFLR
ncbi:flagellar hook-associated protein 3 FlgL [Micromonospora pattaloongensis]|uniref:Flagellin n=1 Tax=Micromonospora pattaloongensis TaxID=405436 RepID=A0A1H3MVM9_9ACTN|nr:flagellin [Micromonospora pattaloongensis]SDY80757.1 flagellar hook-associated protein 3 FlgL [Micromonospora pattaloongensis]